jgi:hypothetical protein
LEQLTVPLPPEVTVLDPPRVVSKSILISSLTETLPVTELDPPRLVVLEGLCET